MASDHDYDDCDDPWCPLFPCRVYREGRERGFSEGHQAGHADGYADGVEDATSALAR